MWVVAGRNKEGKDLSSDNRTCLDVFGMLSNQQRFGRVITRRLKLPLSPFRLYLLSESRLDLVNLGQAYPESRLVYVTFSSSTRLPNSHSPPILQKPPRMPSSAASDLRPSNSSGWHSAPLPWAVSLPASGSGPERSTPSPSAKPFTLQ
jgi:hypothetical protein